MGDRNRARLRGSERTGRGRLVVPEHPGHWEATVVCRRTHHLGHTQRVRGDHLPRRWRRQERRGDGVAFGGVAFGGGADNRTMTRRLRENWCGRGHSGCIRHRAAEHRGGGDRRRRCTPGPVTICLGRRTIAQPIAEPQRHERRYEREQHREERRHAETDGRPHAVTVLEALASDRRDDQAEHRRPPGIDGDPGHHRQWVAPQLSHEVQCKEHRAVASMESADLA